jgi:hypothetical protein
MLEKRRRWWWNRIWNSVVEQPNTVSYRSHRCGITSVVRWSVWDTAKWRGTLSHASPRSGAAVFGHLHASLICCNSALKQTAECPWNSTIFTVISFLSTVLYRNVSCSIPCRFCYDVLTRPDQTWPDLRLSVTHTRLTMKAQLQSR